MLPGMLEKLIQSIIIEYTSDAGGGGVLAMIQEDLKVNVNFQPAQQYSSLHVLYRNARVGASHTSLVI